MHELSDAEALRRIRSDPDAVCVLYDRYVAALVAALARRCGDPEAAWEIVQETFARTLERGNRVHLDAAGSAWPWLWSVARNLLADRRRRGAVDARARARLGIATVSLDEDLDRLLDRLDAVRAARSLREAVNGLPREQREALAGRVASGLSYRELSEATGASEQVLRARVARGLRALRSRFAGARP